MKKAKKGRRISSIIFLLFVLLIAFLLYDSNTRIVTQEYTVYYDDLPVSFNGYRIVQLSDIHAGQFGSGQAELIEAVENANPHIIVITGDMIDGAEDLDIVEPLIKALPATAPVYYVTGNHEWASGALPQLLDMLEDGGIAVLQNEYERLTVGDESIVLAGLDDPNGPKDMKTPETLISEIRSRESDPFIVLLEHRNSFLDRFAGLDIELALCGHAHGGVIRLPFIGGLIGPSLEWLPDYTNGVYTKDGTNMIVSRGLGNRTGVPRFMNNPQIVVAILRTS